MTNIARIASSRAATARSNRAMNELRVIDGETISVGEILARTGLTLAQFGLKFRAGARSWEALGVRK